MRVEYSELMEQLGVGQILSAYETRPWFLHDSEQNIMCSAEVRIGPGTYDVEAEIQFLHNEDSEPSSPEEEGNTAPEQIMLMRFLPNKENIWSATLLLVKGEDYQNKIHSWDDRGAAFFCECIAAMQMEELPDIDALIEEHLVDKSRSGRGGRRGRVGKKGFKVEQKPVSMGMKN